MGRGTAEIDPRQPVIVGVGEMVVRAGEELPTDGPLGMMVEVVRRAAADSGAGDALLRRVGVLAAVPSLSWTDGSAGRRVCSELGMEATTLRTSLQGGNGPQVSLTELASRIAAGRLDAGVVCGAEALASLVAAQKEGGEPGWPDADADLAGDEVLEGEAAGQSDAEAAVGANAPVAVYPLIENALRAAAGAGGREHLERIARLWSRFSAVAAENPFAWTREAHSSDFLATPSQENRPVSDPYLKLLNADIQVDQAAAIVVCSATVARELGIPTERWVFVHAGARAQDEWFVSERREIHRSPAIAACGRALYEHAGVGADDLGPVDLYSCFPAAVELGAAELGLPLDDPSRPLTCTGGLTFFGGPGNNYATHGIAAVARRLREAPAGELGLASALGWYATKHALGLYGNRPPETPFAALEPLPNAARREVAEPGEAEATVETFTVMYDRDGAPTNGIVLALLDDGRRGLAGTEDADLMAAMAEDGFLGARVRLSADRRFALA